MIIITFSRLFQVPTRVVEHDRLDVENKKGYRILYPINKRKTFKKTLSIHNNSNDDNKDIDIDAIIKKKNNDERQSYEYGVNVEEYASDYYSDLIAKDGSSSSKGNSTSSSSSSSSSSSAIVQMALPAQLQKRKIFTSSVSAVIKCKVIKENETWVGAFSEGKIWFEVIQY